MPRFPDKIIDKRAVKRRNNLLGAAFIAGLIGFGAFNTGADGLGLICSLAVGALLAAATSIKTVKHFRGGGGFHR